MEVKRSFQGCCWSTLDNPTLADNKTSDGIGTGSFTSTLTQLIANTKYYVRAYATNIVGTCYGSLVLFTSNPIILATLTTTSVTSITLTTAVSGGNVISDGGGDITARGICWATTENPTLSNTFTIDGTGTGNYNSYLTGLQSGTAYYLRAHATNSVGTTYGNELTFRAYAVMDIDGNGYYSVTIGTQVWTTENMKTTKFNDGTSIQLVTDDMQWQNLITPAY